MLQQRRWGAAALWLRRAARLLHGSAGAMTSARTFDTAYCRTFSRGGGRGATELPDVKLSNEHGFLREALKETGRALDSVRVSTAMAASSEFIDARRAFDEAARSFEGDGLFEADKLDTGSVDGVKPRPSVESYDRAVGVLRTQSMYIEDYQFNLARSIGIARSELNARDLDAGACDAGACARLEECNKLMLAIVGELLDPPSYQPYA
jgi:hypothetical protein